jgi:Spy/CpxP family protein refolding chaperone
MKNIKKITGITLMIMVLSIPAFAWGPGRGQGFGSGPYRNSDNYRNNLTEEQQTKINELHKAFQDKTADARNEMMKKQIDLNAELNKDTPDLKKAKSLQKDIDGLRSKINEARLELMVEAKKVSPDAPYGRGIKMGQGMRGMRRGM